MTTQDFCRFCGASIPPRFGEGTCPKCDPAPKPLTPKRLTQIVRNAQSSAGDPHATPQQLKNRLKELCHLIEKYGHRIFSYEDRTRAVVGLMLMLHEKETEK